MQFSQMIHDALHKGVIPPLNWKNPHYDNLPWPDKRVDPRGYLKMAFNMSALSPEEKAEMERQAEEYQAKVND